MFFKQLDLFLLKTTLIFYLFHRFYLWLIHLVPEGLVEVAQELVAPVGHRHLVAIPLLQSWVRIMNCETVYQCHMGGPRNRLQLRDADYLNP